MNLEKALVEKQIDMFFHSFPFRSAVHVSTKKKGDFLACWALIIQCILYVALKAAKSLNQNFYHGEESLDHSGMDFSFWTIQKLSRSDRFRQTGMHWILAVYFQDQN